MRFPNFPWIKWLNKITKLLLFKLLCIIIVTQCSVSSEDYEDDEEDSTKYLDRTFRGMVPVERPSQIPHHVMFLRPYSEAFPYRAFCGGSIITKSRVLSAASCFVTHKKRNKHDLSTIRAVAGLLQTTAEYPGTDNTGVQQWRSIEKIYTQKFFRTPVFDLAVLVVNQSWNLNQNVREIRFASLNQDFDGVCTTVSLKPSSSWSTTKVIYLQEMHIITRKSCENIMLFCCRLFYCTLNKAYSSVFTEMEGSGLICHNTGDPEEKSQDEGILVGVSSQINKDLPSLYSRVAIFKNWVTDGCEKFHNEVLILFMSFLVIKFL